MNIIEKYKKITNYDLYQYFADYDSFLSFQLPVIIAYYKGNSSVDKSAFQKLNKLFTESIKIEQINSLAKTNLSLTTEFWDLIDNLSIIKTKLETVINLAKWMRSSYIYGYENQSKFKYILKQRQTFENISMELGSQDPNQDWVEIAVSNSIMELDYDKEGGNILDVSQRDNAVYNTTSVVDVMIGDNILGKDLPDKIVIDGEDIVALNITDTMEQSAEICLRVIRGGVPEFPTIGISKYFVGSTLNALRFSSLIREVNNNFKTDDSFKSVQMISNDVKDDVAFYEFKIESRLHQEINKTL